MPYLLCGLLLGLMLTACVSQVPSGSRAPDASGRFVELQVLAINDFHGNLEPPLGDLGGVAYLASHLQAARASAKHNITVSAGDLVGASPLFSSLFHDEPSIEAANIWGLEYHAVGNHEFDEGLAELQRLQKGGSHPEDGNADGDSYHGAGFEILAANLILQDSGVHPLRGYAVKRVANIPVAIIGLTFRDTLSVVSVDAGRGLAFEGEAEAINRLVKKLQGEGIEAFIVLIHQGGLQVDENPDPNQCEKFSGDIVEVISRVSPAVDLFVTGHTHNSYLCQIDGRPVTSAGSYGRLYTRIRMQLDRNTGDLNFKSFRNVAVTRDLPSDKQIDELLGKYKKFVQPLSDKPVGVITATFSRQTDKNGESTLGRLVADSQLEMTRSDGAVVAFMNPGGIRTDLDFASTGTVTFGDIFSVQPFNNTLVNMTLTGAQIKLLLEQQWSANDERILAVSDGFSYSWNAGADVGKRVVVSTMKLYGLPIDLAAEYRITVNNFIADGGDDFIVLKSGKNVAWQAGDLQALKSYLGKHSPVSPGTKARIIRLEGISD